MPVLVRNQNIWKATGAVVGGGGGSTGTLAQPFSVDSAWHSPYDYALGASSQFDYAQFRNRQWWLNDASTTGTMRIYQANASDPTVTISTGTVAYRGWPAGNITWKGPAGMTPDPGGAGDQAMGIILTASNGLRYILELWATTRINDTQFTCKGFGCSCIDGTSSYVPGVSGPGGGLIMAPGNGWGDHAPVDWNSKAMAGIAEAECSILGGMITQWDVAAGVIDHALSALIQPADLAGTGTIRVRPAKMPYHSNLGLIKQGMRIVFPGAPASTLTGLPRWVRDSAVKFGIYARDGAGGNSPIIQVDPGIGAYDRQGVINALNSLMPYARISSWLDPAASPAT
jgi:hypothetical protein